MRIYLCYGIQGKFILFTCSDRTISSASWKAHAFLPSLNAWLRLCHECSGCGSAHHADAGLDGRRGKLPSTSLSPALKWELFCHNIGIDYIYLFIYINLVEGLCQWNGCLSTCGSNAKRSEQLLHKILANGIWKHFAELSCQSIAFGIALLCDEYTWRGHLSAVLCSTSPCPQPPEISNLL